MLTRAWQILLKGIQDVKDSPRPLASAEMALIRLAYASDLPSPERRSRKLAEAPDGPRQAPPLPVRRRGAARFDAARRCGRLAPVAPAPPSAPARAARSAARAASRMSSRSRAPSATSSCQALESDVRLVRFEPGCIAFSLDRGRLAADSRRPCRAGCSNGRASAGWSRLSRARPRRPCARRPTPEAERPSGGVAIPLVQTIMTRFPGAEIVDVRRPGAGPCAGAGRARQRRGRLRRPPSLREDDFEKETPPMDIMGMMKKAQAVQAKMKDVQDELERLEVEGQSGGGMVKVTLNAKGQMKAISSIRAS